MKRLLALFLSVTMLVAATACGSAKTSTDSGTDSDSSTGSGEVISVWLPEYNENEKAAIKLVLDGFNKENEGKYSAEMTYIPRGNSFEYENKISTAAASGTLPDVIMLDGPSMANYADAAIIQPLGGYFEQADLDDFVESVIVQGTYEDQLYTLAPLESSVMLFYNKTMLDAEGITPPTELDKAWTWDDVYEASKKLTKDDVYGINLTWDLGEGQIYGFAPVIWSNGSELVAEDNSTTEGYLNSEQAVQALTQMQRFSNEKLMNLQALENDFWNGGSAMYLSGCWQFATSESYPDVDWGVTYYPASPETKKVVSPSGDWSWGISSNAKDPEAAAAFIKYFTSTESCVSLAEAAGKPPARVSSFDQMEQFNEYPYSILKEQVVGTAHPRPKMVSYPSLSSEFSIAMQDILKGSDAKTSLDTAVVHVDEVIQRDQG